MSVSVIIKGADFTKATSAIQSPNRNGLVGEYFLGSSEAESIINRAGGEPLQVVGSPTYHNGYAKGSVKAEGSTNELYQNNQFDTGIDVSKDEPLTIVAVAKSYSSSEGFGGFCSAYDATSSRYHGIQESSTKLLFNNSDSPSRSASIAKPPKDSWVFYAGSGSPTTIGKIYLVNSSGVSVSESSQDVPWPREMNSTLKFGTRNVQQVDWAYLAVYKRELSESELVEIHKGLSQVMSRRGVSI